MCYRCGDGFNLNKQRPKWGICLHFLFANGWSRPRTLDSNIDSFSLFLENSSASIFLTSRNIIFFLLHEKRKQFKIRIKWIRKILESSKISSFNSYLHGRRNGFSCPLASTIQFNWRNLEILQESQEDYQRQCFSLFSFYFVFLFQKCVI